MQCLFLGGIRVLFALPYLGTKIPAQVKAERELDCGGSREKKMMKERSRKTKEIWSFVHTYNHFINLEERNLKSWSRSQKARRDLLPCSHDNSLLWDADLRRVKFPTFPPLGIVQTKSLGSRRQNGEILFQSAKIDEQTTDQ